MGVTRIIGVALSTLPLLLGVVTCDAGLIVEDVVTQGNSTLEAIRVVEELGAVIQKVVCLIDREAGGAQAISSKYPFQAIFTKSELTP